MTDALPLLAMLAAAGSAYAAAVRAIWNRRGQRVLPPARVACFALGLLTVAGTLAGPLDGLADERFSLHMTQHVLLVLVAAPLLALGTPVTVLVLALPAAQRRRVTTPALRSRVTRFALFPAVGLALFAVVLGGSHLPSIYDAAVENPTLHDLEHLAYLLAALLFWMPVFGRDIGPARLSYPGRLLYLFLASATMTLIGVVLSMSARALYPHYVAAARDAGYSPVADQHTGGVIMWTAGMLTVVPAMAAVVLAWLAEDERRTVRLEQRQDLHHAS